MSNEDAKKIIVEIHWLDSVGLAGWKSPEDWLRDASMIHHSVGWLVDETDDSYIISSSIGECHDDAYAPFKIPKVAVTGFWKLELT